ncbi:YojF family protein [Bacillus sp. JCM 19034]|uniref:YojF family protein n=1 Tax=Bacillus sp. JCM 19034 TaxID=1481928 RepID=UPI000780B930|nr:YojF family protein [Bacillus sp. JCM 19034]
MQPILVEEVQHKLDSYCQKPIFIHLETTNGAYASHHDESFFSAGAFIRNAKVTYNHSKITGNGPFRVGLKLELGWIYAEGLTHFEIDSQERLLLAGHGSDGKLAVALQISEKPFS